MLNEMIPDWLVQLIKNTKPISEELYNNLSNKNYTSGDPIFIGDHVLFGLLLEKLENDENGIPNLNMKIIKFKSSEIGSLYELDLRTDPLSLNASKLPRLKFIENKTNKDYLLTENKI